MSDDLLALAEGFLERCGPGEAMEIYAGRGEETEVRAYEGEIESLASATSAGVGVRVLLDGAADGNGDGGRMGFAWAGSLETEVVAETVAAARDNARFATADPHMALASPDGTPPADPDVWHPGEATTDEKVAAAIELERAVRHADSRIRQVSSSDYGDARLETAVATTTGIRATSRRTSAYLSVAAIAGEGAESQTASGYSVGRRLEDLDPDRARREAVERATRMLGARKPTSARSTVVFDPRVVSTLVSLVGSALSGEAVVKGRSFLSGRVGEAVGAPGVTVTDDPTDARAYGASAYDAEGLACRRNVLIDGGVLRGFVYDTVSARRAGTASTGSAVRGGYGGTPGAGCRAMVLAPGTATADEILTEVGEGFYVQSVTGVHSGVNPVSGDLSLGAEGLVVRGGELAEPFREVTVASTLQRMLRSVLHVGSDLDWGPGMAAGQTVAIGDMSLSGT